MKDKKYCVYKHINKLNGKIYIGITCQIPEERFKNGKAYKGCTHFNRAIEKYGWDNFKHIIIYSNLSEDIAKQLEIEQIKKFQSNDFNNGYNISDGGDLFYKTSTKPIYQYSLDGIFVNKYEDMKKASDITSIDRASINKVAKGYNNRTSAGGYFWSYNYINQDEVKDIIKNRKANTEYKLKNFYSEQSKERGNPVIQLNLKDNKEIKKYESVRQASIVTGIDRKTIMQVCNGIYSHAGGFGWKYADILEGKVS